MILFMRCLLPVSEVLPGCKVRLLQPVGLFSQYLPKSSAFRQKYGKERTVRHQQTTPHTKITFLQKEKGKKELWFKSSISLFTQIILVRGEKKKKLQTLLATQKAKDSKEIIESTQINYSKNRLKKLKK